MNTVDARGLSCPQPVLLTLEAIEKMKEGELVVLVDTEAARENVSRAVASKGWKVKEIVEENGEYKLIIAK
ncbi:SirA-like domain-containing protein [Thermodesulfatator indicus DSM 15286]|uniref:SirA-like domain-containing protein n=1 Tax=Thermodesulfatator indicus (strain DSM 15286 / JCM 11887 / CIR29812) TaxID=667014 RepID=F8A8D6_THEID|nr:sulfurtransferase TusA family protein [Thermodesulfatator indicus]AEH43940.1 SirA-like domain-containing protein [Thermodesulfatator indicus DSM 15286]